MAFFCNSVISVCLLGVEIDPVSQVGAFITMNPGYLGRSELPEGLKALFRPITVMTPDFRLIMENMCMAEGFTEAGALGLKFSVLYALAADLLSKSNKYDWGMRAIKSVLVVAGSFKRADPTLPEQAILMRSLRDTNEAKIEGDDLIIFMGLLGDLFPGINVPRARDYEFEEIIVTALQEEFGYTHDEKGYLLLKITQLVELLSIRHCIFLMGNAGRGIGWRSSFGWGICGTRSGRMVARCTRRVYSSAVGVGDTSLCSTGLCWRLRDRLCWCGCGTPSSRTLPLPSLDLSIDPKMGVHQERPPTIS